MTYVRQTRLFRSKRLILLSMFILIAIMLLILFFTIYGKNQAVVEGTSISGDRTIDKQMVVRAARAIQAGETADDIKFEVVETSMDLVPKGAVTSMQQLKNKIVANSLEEKEFLMQRDLIDSSLWYEEGERLIEHTFQEEAIPASVEIGSIVDIKLFRHGAVDEIVVAKAVVVGMIDNTLSFHLNSVEQEYIKEANTEGSLFLVKYLDKSQEASEITYIPAYIKNKQSRQ
jgi:hypothetical protein